MIRHLLLDYDAYIEVQAMNSKVIPQVVLVFRLQYLALPSRMLIRLTGRPKVVAEMRWWWS